MSGVSNQDDSPDVPTLQLGSIIEAVLKVALFQQHYQRKWSLLALVIYVLFLMASPAPKSHWA